MGTRSLMKKRNREPHKKNPLSPNMASLPTRRSKALLPYTTVSVSVLLSAALVVSLITLLLISSYKLRTFQSDVSYYMVNVLNEFPHDPQAFTQVKFSFLIMGISILCRLCMYVFFFKWVHVVIVVFICLLFTISFSIAAWYAWVNMLGVVDWFHFMYLFI